jgi:hypothetical protein
MFLRLHLFLCLKEVSMEIGNSLGIFYEVDLYSHESRYTGLARTLIGLDLRKGLAKSMEIQRGFDSFDQTIYYEGIPFRCVQCHIYGHLAIECNYSNYIKVWAQKKQLSIEEEDLRGIQNSMKIAKVGNIVASNFPQETPLIIVQKL